MRVARRSGSGPLASGFRPGVWAALLLAASGLGLTGGAHADYIVDRLLVGLHEDRSPESPLIKVVPTGSDIEVLERTETFVRVRTEDGMTGWVDASYVTEDKPAWLVVAELRATQAERTARLTEAEAKAERLQQTLAQRSGQEPDRGSAPTSALPDPESERKITQLQVELTEANERARLLEEEAALREIAVRKDTHTEIEALRAELAARKRAQGTNGARSSTDLREIQRLAEENQRLKARLDAQADTPPRAAKTRALDWAWSVTNATWWEIGALVFAAILAFFLGAQWIERSSRRRLGGFRL